MNRASKKRKTALAVAVWIALVANVYGQGRGGRGGGRAAGPPPSPKAEAPIDLTGYWVSVVDEDWRFRMLTPSKGDTQSVPLNPEGLKVTDAWDPAKDEAAGDQCKSYGAAAIMRNPGILHITWQDDDTLRVEMDTGTQTRLLHFGNWKSPDEKATWQGDSVAEWETPQPAGRGAPRPPGGNLKVITTHMRAGYLRKNGVPYSAGATLTEYYDLIQGVDGKPWLIVTSMVQDPMYLRMTFITSSNFKKQPDGSGWDPTPCSAKW
jgi:hypothetical protein